MRAAAFALAVTLLPAVPWAQRGGHRSPSPLRGRSAVTLQLLRVERTNLARARAALPTMLTPVTRCLDAAREADPVALVHVRRVEIILGVGADGAANAVEFDPPREVRGLSACLGSALLRWRQGGPSQPMASVYLLLVRHEG